MGETSVWEPEGANQDRTDFSGGTWTIRGANRGTWCRVRRSTPPTCGMEGIADRYGAAVSLYGHARLRASTSRGRRRSRASSSC